jgi:hypothetical protein
MFSTVLLFVGLLEWTVVTTARAQISTVETQTTIAGPVTVINVPSTGGRIDYVNAQPLKLPGVPPRSDAEVVQDLIPGADVPADSGRVWLCNGLARQRGKETQLTWAFQRGRSEM